MSPFDNMTLLHQILALWSCSIVHTVLKHTRNAIRSLVCEFGTIWATCPCFCEIWLQLDSISLLHEISVNLCWICYFMSPFDNMTLLHQILALWTCNIAHPVLKHTTNAIRLLVCEFGKIWVTCPCFCEIWLQIDSISLLHEICYNLCWICDFMSPFDNMTLLHQILALWSCSIAHTVLKHTTNAIRVLVCDFETIWATFACFYEIWLKIDSISLLHEIGIN
jgi:succinate dehydrogenase/fumarate reductase cytochrome b subunit